MAKEECDFWGDATYLEKTVIMFGWVVVIIVSVVIIFLVKNEIVL
jgi:hypothetical protein